MSPPAFQSALSSALASISAPSFCCSGVLPADTPDPQLRVEGMPAPLPLPFDAFDHADQLAQLKRLSAKAPCGIGAATVVDESVRRCRQIDASRLSLSAGWRAAVQALARRAAAQLGVADDAVSAHLHKLVLYSPGDMFRAHVDGEKLPRMFATLVVQLPSACAGALLIVKHAGVETHIDLSSGCDDRDDAKVPSYAAFFTDCVHEVTALQYGVRIALLYNLVRSSPDAERRPAQSAGSHAPETDADVVRRLQRCASEWSRAARCEPAPLRLMLPLQHRYTQRDVSFANLKGRDAALIRHVRQSGAFEMRVLLVEKHNENFAKDGVDSDPEDDDAHFERVRAMSPPAKRRRMLLATNLGGEEPFEQMTKAVKAVSEKGDDRIGAEWMYDLDWKVEVLDGDLFSSPGLPVDGDYRVTGNEGIRIELKYQRAVLALWPKENAPLLALMREFDRRASEFAAQVTTGAADDEHDAQWALLRSLSAFYPQLALESLPTLLEVACRRGEKDVAKRLLWQAAGNFALSPDRNSAYREVYIYSHSKLGVATEKHVAAFMRAIELCGATEIDEIGEAVRRFVWKTWHTQEKHCFALCHALLDVDDAALVKLGVEMAEMLKGKGGPHLRAALLLRDECEPLYAALLKEFTARWAQRDLLIAVLKETESAKRAKARAFFLQPVFKACIETLSSMKEDDVAFMYKIGSAYEESADLDELSTQVRRTKSVLFVHKVLQHADMLAVAKTDAARRLAQWHAGRLRKVQGTRLAAQPDTEIEGQAALSAFLRGDAKKFVSEPLESFEEADSLSKRLSGFSVWANTLYAEDQLRLRVERGNEQKWNVSLTDDDVNEKMEWLRNTYGVCALESGSRDASKLDAGTS